MAFAVIVVSLDVTAPLLQVVLPPALYALFNASLLAGSGQTVGKWMLNLRIVDQHTHQIVPVWNSLVLRYLLFASVPCALLYPPLGQVLDLSYGPLLVACVLWLDILFIFGKRRRCVHDLVAGTIVVRPGVVSLRPQSGWE